MYTWQQGTVTICAFDVNGGIDFNPDDIVVRFGANDSVRLVKLGGSESMDGLGLVVTGATSVHRIVDARSGPLGDLAFVVSDSPVSKLSLKGPVVGYDLNGMDIGGISVPADIDGDGDVHDLLSIGVGGDLLKTRLKGDVGGDFLVDGGVRAVRAGGDLMGDFLIDGDARVLRVDGSVAGELDVSGSLRNLKVGGSVMYDVYVGGDLARAKVGGPLGDTGSSFEVMGSLNRLSVGSHRSPADVMSDLVIAGGLRRAAVTGDVHGAVDVGGDVRNFSAGYICESITVAGNLGTLRTESTLATPVGPEDWVLDNPGAMPDGDLTVAGSIGKIVAA
jgi:hypothetical protein